MFSTTVPMVHLMKKLRRLHPLVAANGSVDYPYFTRSLKSSTDFENTVPVIKPQERQSKQLVSNAGSLRTDTCYDSSVPSDVSPAEALFPLVVHQEKEKEISYWETEKGLKVKEKLWTFGGRFMRVLILNNERYDNWWEKAMLWKVKYLKKLNRFDTQLSISIGPEIALSSFILELKGALKFLTENHWIDSFKIANLSAKSDCAVEAIDLRNSALSYDGMKCFDEATCVKYLNVADSPTFDNYCMTKLHVVAHSLEYLDISGTSVTPEAFTYLRLFSRLRWLNISRLPNPNLVESLLSYIREILPKDCVIVYNDTLPSKSYGTDTALLTSSDSSQDLVEIDNSEIGNLAAFNSRHNFNALQVNDVSTIYQLWKTPKIDELRENKLENLKPKEKSLLMTVVEYASKAEKFKPLF